MVKIQINVKRVPQPALTSQSNTSAGGFWENVFCRNEAHVNQSSKRSTGKQTKYKTKKEKLRKKYILLFQIDSDTES